MNAALRFKCGACGTVHAHQTLAQQCCLPLVWHVWVCRECGQEHGASGAAAEVCCRPVVNLNGTLYPMTA